MTKPTLEVLRKEFDKSVKYLITNEAVADWWLSKFQQRDKELIRKMRDKHIEMMITPRKDVAECKEERCDHYSLGIDDFAHEVDQLIQSQ